MGTIIDQMRADSGGSSQAPLSIIDQMKQDAALSAASSTQKPDSSGVLSQLGDAASAFGHHVMNLPHGAAQFVENAVSSGAQKLAPNSSVANYLSNLTAQDNAAMAAREKAYQASTPNSAGAYAGATAGEVAPFLISGGLASGVKGLGDLAATATQGAVNKLPAAISKYVPDALSKVSGGAVQGGAISTALPVTSPDYWNQKGSQIESGAALGGAIPAATSAAKGLINQLKGAVAPLANPQGVVKNALVSGLNSGNGDLQATIEALKNPQELVPGSTPTTAQTLGSPFLVQAEKTLTSNPEYRQQFENLANQNNAARLAQLNEVAGSSNDLQNALSNRSSSAKELYGSAFNTNNLEKLVSTPELDTKMSQLMQRPAMQQALKTARTLAQNEGLSDAEINPIQNLHYTKMALDDQISNAVRSGDANHVRALTNTKHELLSILDKISPDYSKALQTYAEQSSPINSMEAGQSILNKISGNALNSSKDIQLTLPAYKSALAQALKGSEYGIEPSKQSALQAIQDDLQRATISNSLKSAGSDTAFNLQAPSWLGKQIYGDQFSGKANAAKVVGTLAGGLGGLVTGGPFGAAGGATAALAGMQKLGALGASRVNNVLTQALADPKYAAALLESPETSFAIKNQLAKALMQKVPEALSYEGAGALNNSH